MLKVIAIAAIFLTTSRILFSQNEFKDVSSPSLGVPVPKVQDLIRDVHGDKYCDAEKGLLTASVLRQAGEASLLRAGRESELSVRVTASPTRGKPIILRLYENKGSYFISLRRLSGRGGYELGHVELFGDIFVSKQDFQDMLALANKVSISTLSEMTLRQRFDTIVMDGSCWTVEITSKGEYKVIDLFSPILLEQGTEKLSPQLTKQAMSDYLDLVRKMFKLAGMSSNDYLEADSK